MFHCSHLGNGDEEDVAWKPQQNSLKEQITRVNSEIHNPENTVLQDQIAFYRAESNDSGVRVSLGPAVARSPPLLNCPESGSVAGRPPDCVLRSLCGEEKMIWLETLPVINSQSNF